MSRIEPHWEVLPAAQRDIWPHLAPSVDLGLVLYGGTAIALRLGHRTSIDFDFFTEQPLDREVLAHSFAFLGRSEVIQDRPNTFSVLAPAGNGRVKISFFGEIATGRARQLRTQHPMELSKWLPCSICWLRNSRSFNNGSKQRITSIWLRFLKPEYLWNRVLPPHR